MELPAEDYRSRDIENMLKATVIPLDLLKPEALICS